MGRVLTQEEIDQLISTRQENSEARVSPAKNVQKWSVREAGQLSPHQAHAISGLHESFARNLTHSLGAYLRVPFSVTLVSVQQIAYEDFLGMTPEITYVVAFDVDRDDAAGLMQIDHSLVFPIVDVLLGGTGSLIPVNRDTSEIEEQIMADVSNIICRELQTAWTPLGFSPNLGDRQRPGNLQRFLPPSEKSLTLSFEINMPGAKGTMNLLFPASISNAMLRKLSRNWGYRKSKVNFESVERIRQRLLECRFKVQLGMPSLHVPLHEILRLHEGSVLRTRVPVAQPPSLLLGNREIFRASAVRHSGRRAAHLAEPYQSDSEVSGSIQ